VILSHLGLVQLIISFDYEKLSLVEGIFPRLAFFLGEFLLVILSIVMLFVLFLIFAKIVDYILPTFYTKKEVVEKIKSNEKKLSNLTKKNKELKELIG
jgi:hypothetical protein